MVTPDPSYVPSSHADQERPRLAPVSDRLLALLIDFFVFSPVVSLACASLVREYRTIVIVDPQSPEAVLTWFSLLGGSLLLMILAESLVLLKWGATPGQRFLQIRVRSWPGEGPLTLSQCLARTALWWLSLPFILPLLGAYTNPFRRTFHDRATDTIVTTLKSPGDPGPLEIERQFFRSWSALVFLVFLVAMASVLTQLRQVWQRGLLVTTVDDDSSGRCQWIDDEATGKTRLDHAIAGFLAGQWSAECLEHEADDALWDEPGAGTRSLANVAKGLSFEDDAKMAAVYFSRACEVDAKDEACGMSRFMTSEDEERGDLLRRGGLTLVSSRMLLVNDAIERGQSTSAVALIKDLRTERGLGRWLERQEVRALWKLRGASADRSPASAGSGDSEEKRRLLDDFETRYDLR